MSFDMTALFAPRHLVVSAVATLIAAGLFGGAVGFAAADDEATVTVPTDLALPGPRLGDVVRYNVTTDSGSYIHVIARAGAAEFLDRHGDRVAAEHGDDGVFYAAETGRYLGMHWDDLQTYSEVWEGNNPLITSQTIDGFSLRLDRLYPDEDLADCLRTNAFQARHVALAAGVDVFGACRLGAIVLPAGVLSFPQPLDGQVLLVADDGQTRIESTWDPSYAYPVQVAVEQGDNRVVAVLVDTVEGSLAVPAQGKGQSAPEFVMRPVRAWGMDEEGFQHPFSPQSAYERALTEPTWTVLAEWSQRHPDHVPIHLEYDEWQGSQGTFERRWYFGLTDGASLLDMEVVMEVRSADDFLFGLVEDSPPVITYHFEGESEPLRDGMPDSMPDLWPTAASAQARMQAFGHEALANENMTGWRIERFPQGDEIVPALLLETQRDERWAELGGVTPPYEDELYARSMFFFDGTAIAIFQDAERQESGQRYIGQDSADPRPGGQGGDDPGFATATSKVAGAAAWTVPTGAKAAGAGAAVIATGLLVWLWPLVKGLPVFGLFSRVRRPEMLGHPQRRRIMEAIEAEPGIHFGALLRRLDLSNGSAVHHLRLLTQSGLIRERKEGGYTCYFAGRPTRHAVVAAPALKADGAKQIMAAIQRDPGCSAKDVAAAIGLSPGTVNHHLKRLHEAGLVDVRRDGRSLALRLAA